MLKTLIKKQLFELNRNFFYDPKKGKMRSKTSSIVFIGLYVLLVVVVLGGMFAGMSLLMCEPFTELGLDWLYFDIMVLVALMLGVFGSVFNTYASLYKAKDNDLLLSLPVPTRYVLISRLASVYLMGLMFSAVVMLPAAIVYFIVARPGFAGVLGPLLLTVLVSVFVFVLSCILGWIVAKVSTHIKNKSIVTVLLSLAFIGIYYFVCFNASELLQELIVNALTIGAEIRDASRVLYAIGMCGAGEWQSMLLLTVCCVILFRITYLVLERSFLRMATSSGKTAKRVYRESKAKLRPARAALLSREFSHLLSSPIYMLNCCLGTPIMLIAGVILVLKGQDIAVLSQMLPFPSDFLAVMMSLAVCLLSSMNDLTAPAVSLEGKNIWIAQSLPVKASSVLRAKLEMSIILTALPTLFCSVCVIILLRPAPLTAVMCLVLPIIFVLMSSAFGLVINLNRPNLSWQNETVPVKQSMGVLIVMLGGWAVAAAAGVIYYLVCQSLSPAAYMAIVSAVMLAAYAVEAKWIYTRGSKIFSYL